MILHFLTKDQSFQDNLKEVFGVSVQVPINIFATCSTEYSDQSKKVTKDESQVNVGVIDPRKGGSFYEFVDLGYTKVDVSNEDVIPVSGRKPRKGSAQLDQMFDK